MSPEEMFQKVLEKSHRGKAIKAIGEGIAKNITDSNCTVFRDGQPELHDVRFHATEDTPGSHIVKIPADGSSVIYAIIENQDTEAVLLMCSEVEKVLIHIGSIKYEIDKDGHLIAFGADTLAKVMSEFIDEVAKIIVIQGRSPNVPALTAIKQRVNKILK